MAREIEFVGIDGSVWVVSGVDEGGDGVVIEAVG